MPVVEAQALAADAERGAFPAKAYEQCHGVPSDARMPGQRGPNLWGALGRQAGKAEYGDYSAYLTESEITWTGETMNSYLAPPFRFLPGTTKYPTEITDPKDRTDSIAFL